MRLFPLVTFLCSQTVSGIGWDGPVSTANSRSPTIGNRDITSISTSINQPPRVFERGFLRCGYNDTFSVPEITTSTNLGPLTTKAVFPDECQSNFYNFQTFGLGWGVSFITQGCAVKACCPGGNFYTENFGWMSSYYSPGICPVGYKSCNPPPSPTALSSAPDEIIKFCCPTNYDCPVSTPGMVFGACFSWLVTSADITLMQGVFEQTFVSTYPWPANSTTGPCVIAYPIQVRTGPDDSQTASTTASIGVPQSTTAVTSPASLSGGAIAGIVIAAISGITLLVAAMYIFRRRRDRRTSWQAPNQGQANVRGELEGFSEVTYPRYELGTGPAELGTSFAQPPPPKSLNDAMAEMGSSCRQWQPVQRSVSSMPEHDKMAVSFCRPKSLFERCKAVEIPPNRRFSAGGINVSAAAIGANVETTIYPQGAVLIN
ncbi:hypothetical protein B0J13DRAFT_642900 [Dactylonectria estremocensis]|uniref:Uncharacterized protein n=1 Tax=Dactylonectria estremocensis TaxID=1079267 RepID=A0A9P9FDL5_9HYPO|nr:hypothetical protein B0J13DRAFT_642900 [Dactylonectria estremocensis]